MASTSRRPLKVGIQLPEIERVVRWTELRAMAVLAEEIGLDSIWVGEHLLYRFSSGESRGPWEAWSLLAGLATATSRIELGPLVACTAFHNPAVLAKQADTIDEISDGRLILGLGAGWNPVEFAAFGIPFENRVARFEEAFTIIRTLLREGSIDFVGRFHEARECELVPRGPRPGGPPLMVGSVGERMLRITAPHVDSWNAWYADTGNRPEGVAPLRDLVDRAAVEAGRDPAAIERTVAVQVRMTGGTGRFMGDTDPKQAVVPASGEPEVLAATLRAYAAEGIGHVQLVLDPISLDSIAELAPVLDLLEGGP